MFNINVVNLVLVTYNQLFVWTKHPPSNAQQCVVQYIGSSYTYNKFLIAHRFGESTNK